MKNTIIAIDGHSSCGKSTVAKQIAKKLEYIYVDTGAMYRAVTFFCLEHNLIVGDSVDEKTLKEKLDSIKIEFTNLPSGQRTMLNGKDVEDEIRGLRVSEKVSIVSKIKFVRDFLVNLQRNYGKVNSIVMDGRDIGTVVFPDADLKIFMTASAEIRARRRYDELTAKGETVDFGDILKNVEDRDFQDSNRKESPLKKADDAIILDNTSMTREEQLVWILQKLEVKKSDK